MKILVTGSKGVIGRGLVRELRERGHDVYGIDLQHSTGKNYFRCDIAEYRQLENVVKRVFPELIYNCAAEFGRHNGEDYYEQLWRTNVIGTKHLIRLQESLQFKLIHFSSSEVYGDYSGEMVESITDTVAIRQLNDYAITKWANETQIRNSEILKDTKTVIVRPFNTYGIGEDYKPYRSVNIRFCYSALNNLPISVHKGHFRSSSYIDDCVRTISNIADNFIPGRIYNIGSRQFHNIEELADIIWEYTGADRNLISYVGAEKLTTKIKKINNDLSVSELGHEETVTLEQGVHATIDWMKNENISWLESGIQMYNIIRGIK